MSAHPSLLRMRSLAALLTPFRHDCYHFEAADVRLALLQYTDSFRRRRNSPGPFCPLYSSRLP